LRELHQLILNQDSSLELPNAPTPERPADLVRGHDSTTALVQPREARKTVTVLCASISATTADGGIVDPEALRRVVSRTLAAVREPVESYGGSMTPSTGGVLTAIFGVPTIHEDDAARAVRAAAAIAARLQPVEAEPAGLPTVHVQHGIGVSTGEVVVG